MARLLGISYGKILTHTLQLRLSFNRETEREKNMFRIIRIVEKIFGLFTYIGFYFLLTDSTNFCNPPLGFTDIDTRGTYVITLIPASTRAEVR